MYQKIIIKLTFKWYNVTFNKIKGILVVAFYDLIIFSLWNQVFE